MQYIHSPFILKALQNTLKQATFEPTITNTPTYGIYVNQVQLTCQNKPKKPFWQKSKTALQVLGVLALIVPTKSLTHVMDTPNFEQLRHTKSNLNTQTFNDMNTDTDEAPSTLDKIIATKTLTVAVMPEQFFVNDEHRHGFGYEVAHRYAQHLGATLSIKNYSSKELATAALNLGEVDMIVGNQLDDTQMLSTAIGCKPSLVSRFGQDDAQFAFHKNNTKLLDLTQDYLCRDTVIENTKTIAKFHQTNALDDYSINHFHKTLKERLPKYQATFKKQAQKYDQDWQLLAAISYQESHLNPNAVSRTGVEGLMMLTQDTASEMGVSDRTNPTQSIQGGAKYLDKLDNYFWQVDESERLWFVLSAYNMGPGTVKSIQRKLKAQGDNPNSWTDFYAYLSKNAKKNGRYVQCMHYVTNIRTYFETIKSKSITV